MCKVRGVRGRCSHPPPPLPPSFLLSLPRPPPQSARPAPPRPRDPAACSRRALAPCPTRSRGAPSRLRGEEPSEGTWEPPPVANAQVSGREGAQGLPSSGGESGLGQEPLLPGLAFPSPSSGRAWNWRRGVRSYPGFAFPRLPRPALEDSAPFLRATGRAGITGSAIFLPHPFYSSGDSRWLPRRGSHESGS